MCGRRLRKLFVLFLVLAWVPQLVMASWPVRESKLPKVEPVVEVEPVVAVVEVELVKEAPVVEESLQTESTPSEVILLEKELNLSKQELENLKAEVEEFKNYKNEQKGSEIKDAIDTIVLGVELKEKAFKAEQARADAAELAYASAKAENAKLIKEKNKLGVIIMPKGFYDIHSDQWGFGLNLGLAKGGMMSEIGVEKTITSWDSFKNTDNMRVSVGFGFIL